MKKATKATKQTTQSNPTFEKVMWWVWNIDNDGTDKKLLAILNNSKHQALAETLYRFLLETEDAGVTIGLDVSEKGDIRGANFFSALEFAKTNNLTADDFAIGMLLLDYIGIIKNIEGLSECFMALNKE